MCRTLNTVFVLGAGFSFEQGYPLAREMRQRVIDFLEEEQHIAYYGYMKPWHGNYSRGSFYEGLFRTDPNELLQFEELLIELQEKTRRGLSGPFCITDDVLRRGARRLLWSIQDSDEHLLPAYTYFADRIGKEWHRYGVISFNWDLQVERVLHQLTRISQVSSIFSAARRRFCYKNHEVVAYMERRIWHTRWVNRNRGAFGSFLTVD